MELTSMILYINIGEFSPMVVFALSKCVYKVKLTADACRTQGLQFFPLAVETLGGFHSVATGVVRRIGQALARKKGCEEREPTSQLFSRLSVTLMRGNAMMLCSRCPDVISAGVDGAE